MYQAWLGITLVSYVYVLICSGLKLSWMEKIKQVDSTVLLADKHCAMRFMFMELIIDKNVSGHLSITVDKTTPHVASNLANIR